MVPVIRRPESIMRRCLLKLSIAGAMQLTANQEAAAKEIKSAGRSSGQSSSPKIWLTLPPTPKLPRPARSGFAPVNGTNLFYAQFGSGTPILMLHGGLANSDYWGHQVEKLATEYLVTVFDTRGHGRSPMGALNFTYRTLAEDAQAICDYLDLKRPAVVGWSDGAIAGLYLTLLAPEKTSGLFAFGANSSVNALIPGGSKTPVFSKFFARSEMEYQRLSPTPDKWQALVAGLRRMWSSEPNLMSTQLNSIKNPVTISDGQFDEVIRRENTERMARDIPKAQLRIMPNTSHFAMLQDPFTFNQSLLRFVSDLT